MKSKLFWLLLLVSFNAFAEENPDQSIPYSGDSLRLLYVEMLYLYQTGMQIHQKYDTTDRAQLKTCIEMEGYNGTRARSAVGIANRLGGPKKDFLVQAAWEAYSCVRCGSKASSCDNVPEYLKEIKQMAIDAAAAQQAATPEEN